MLLSMREMIGICIRIPSRARREILRARIEAKALRERIPHESPALERSRLDLIRYHQHNAERWSVAIAIVGDAGPAPIPARAEREPAHV